MPPRDQSISVDSYLSAYAPSLGRWDPRLPETPVHVLVKYTRGGCAVDGTADLTDVLIEPWPADAQFTMYTSPSGTRLVKDGATTGIRFEVAVVDLDFDEHHTRPSIENFCDLMVSAYINDHTPNVVYSTRGGARFVYLIEPIEDAEVFEVPVQPVPPAHRPRGRGCQAVHPLSGHPSRPPGSDEGAGETAGGAGNQVTGDD